MDDYPSNSQTARSSEAEQSQGRAAKVSAPAGRKAKEKIEPVVVGQVSRRKPSLGKRFKKTFVGGDAKGVWGYVVMEVLIPAAKDMMSDAISQGVDRTLFGDSRPRSRRAGGSSPYGRVNYNAPYSRASREAPWHNSRDEQPRRSMSRSSRATHDFDDIVLETRGEAEEVIDRLFDLISKYDVATVSDLYELTGITGNFTDEKWGWTNLQGADVARVRGGYLLNLPRPEPLD